MHLQETSSIWIGDFLDNLRGLSNAYIYFLEKLSKILSLNIGSIASVIYSITCLKVRITWIDKIALLTVPVIGSSFVSSLLLLNPRKLNIPAYTNFLLLIKSVLLWNFNVVRLRKFDSYSQFLATFLAMKYEAERHCKKFFINLKLFNKEIKWWPPYVWRIFTKQERVKEE